MKTLLYQLLQRGHRSSSAVRSANTSGFWPSLRNKSALLLPWMQRAQDFQTLPSFAPPLNYSLQSGSSGSYEVGRCYGYPGGFRGVYDFDENQVGGDASLLLRFPTGDPHCGSRSLILPGDLMHRMMMTRASDGVYRSLVGLAIYHRGKLSEVFSGTIVHPDGIIATSANCFKPLKGTEFKISVRLLHDGTIHKGVLLEADFCSDIAFVKIKSCHRLIAATFGKLDSMRDKSVVAAGCLLEYSSWNYATSDYNLGVLRLDAGGSIDQEMENPKSHNEKKSGQLIKAEILYVTRSCIGGPLVKVDGGFFAIIHNIGLSIEATPIDDVFKYLEHFKKHGEHAEELSCTSSSGSRVSS